MPGVNPPQVVPGARQDVMVTDAVSGEPRRLTTYVGTVWLAPPPQISSSIGGMRIVTNADVEALDPSRPVTLFLPDSLAYRSGADAVVAASGAPTGRVDAVGADSMLLYPLGARLAPDPRDNSRAWVAVELQGHGRLVSVTYTVTVTAAPDAVL